jgi:fatty-acyl-CoA synthase
MIPTSEMIFNVEDHSNMAPTPTYSNLPLRHADFATLSEALDYAAQGDTGFNFYKKDARLKAVLSYAQLRDEASVLAQQLLSLKPRRGARLALVAETDPDFLRFFFACQYAGLVPVPLPISMHLGGSDTFVSQLRLLLKDCRADFAVAPEKYMPHLRKAADGLPCVFCGSPEEYYGISYDNTRLTPSTSKELAYLQYTSGSTRFPRGVMISQENVMNNLSMMTRFGLRIRPGDRGVSWLPFYHDMGLVGFVLGAVGSQMSVDYLSPVDFVRRPRLWLALMSKNKATISFSPPVGYELALERIKKEHIEALDLSAWRVAGVGAEPIRIGPLNRFADIFKPSGFQRKSFVAGYGMAETSLAISFSPLGRGLNRDFFDPGYLGEFRAVLPVDVDSKEGTLWTKGVVNCGESLPGYDIEIRDSKGRELAERKIGTLYVRGPSVMQGYFEDAEATEAVLSPDGWLNTGDLAYRVGSSLYITGRQKDMIIINGRNIWPEDLEYVAENQSEVKRGDVTAFSVIQADGHDQAVLVIQVREKDASRQIELARRVEKEVRRSFGIFCLIDLVPPHTLPKTTSGKLSRTKARNEYLIRKTA